MADMVITRKQAMESAVAEILGYVPLEALVGASG